MKKYYFLLIAALCIGTSLKAAPGDTTWVQANNVDLTYYNNYDTTVVFPAPGTNYRKIYMVFTLGKYMCPGYNPATAGSGSVPWCGDWDYTVLNYLMTRTGDTLELGRLITPYANALAPRTPWAATQTYTYDVTDYAYLLQDTATMRILFSGYSGGFTANIRFAFIEGTPDRDVIAVQRLWHGYFAYGDTAHSDSEMINTHFVADTETVPAGTVTTDLKFIVTGHGSDPNQCCEFMSHNYQVLLNGSSIDTETIWRDNCGSNWLYPQSGTWLYNRANWCPGDLIYPKYTVLPVTAGSTYNVAIQFDPYVSTGAGGYQTEASLFYYKGMNKVLDASIDDIIAPTTNQLYFRQNPLVGAPTILVKNTGSTTIDSISFQYGIQDSVMQSYTWVGSLASLQDTQITLPALTALNNLAGASGAYTFVAKIVNVNGSTDDDATNNTMTSPFIAAPVWPSPFKIRFSANNEGLSYATSTCATSWIIYDVNNNIVRERTNAHISTIYNDTVNLPRGAYKLQVTDANCDGLSWWGFPAGTTDGSISASQLSGGSLYLNGNFMASPYSNDFGCGFVQYFFLDSMGSLAVNNITAAGAAIEAYPNPAQGVVNIDISGIPDVSGKLQIIDMLGRVVLTAPCNEDHQQLNVEQLVSGVYTVLFVNSTNSNRLEARLLITK